MSASPGEFCVIASEAYKNLGTSSKQDLGSLLTICAHAREGYSSVLCVYMSHT